MGDNDITCRIVNILNFKLGVSDKILTKQYETIPLTGHLFRLSSVRLTYLFFELEKEFNCTIDANQIKAYELNTILGISKVISEIKSKCD